MKLEEIGFYTLSDKRALSSSATSQLMRCELILTNKCNFNCPYCRKSGEDMSFGDSMKTLELWCDDGLKNVRFSGGEPTLYDGLWQLVSYCRDRGVGRVAVSTNGSAKWEYYQRLIDCGVNDFSVSLDACCASTGDKMAGGINGVWKDLTENIRRMSLQTYTTVGIVINDENIEECVETIKFADSLGVSDIRIVPSAQYNELLSFKIHNSLLDKYPILKYRVNNFINHKNVRGITYKDNPRCSLALDDMVVSGNKHYPCVIYMREKGRPIGIVGKNMRKEREAWVNNHNSFKDDICKKNCLDVCISHNNKKENYGK